MVKNKKKQEYSYNNLDEKIDLILSAAAQIFGIPQSAIQFARVYIRTIPREKKIQFIQYLKEVLLND